MVSDLRVLLLQADGTYRESETSAAFPYLPTAEVARFLTEEDTKDESRWARRFRVWVRTEVLPRFQRGPGAE